MKSIDLNADVAEGFPNDGEIIRLVSSVNIACGAHAGDAHTMRTAMEIARESDVQVGAHPGYEDRADFGRKPLSLPVHEIAESVSRQLDGFLAIAARCGAHPHHVKLHGALYHRANQDKDLALALSRVISNRMPGTLIYTWPFGHLATTASDFGLQPIAEGFADRLYLPDGTLAPRDTPGAVLTTDEASANQAAEIALHRRVRTADGSWIPLRCESLCIHGDGDHAVESLHNIRRALELHGLRIQSP